MASKKRKNTLAKKMIILAIVAIAAVAIFFSAKHFFGAGDDLAATVNGEPIMKEDVIRVYLNVPPEYRQTITAQSILEGMIVEKLIVQEAEKKGYEVSEEEIDDYIAGLMSTYSMTEENLTQTLASSGFSLADLKSSFKEKMMISQLLENEIFSEIEVSDDEVEKFYDENIESFTTPETIQASHILVNNSVLAESIRKKALGGMDFAKLAKEYSTCPSGPRGGTLGWFSRGEMIKPFEDEAFSLKLSQISNVVQTIYGYHIIKVTGKKPAEVKELNADLKEEIRSALIKQKQDATLSIYTEQLEAAADIEIFMDYEEKKEPDIVANVKKTAYSGAESQPEQQETASPQLEESAVDEQEAQAEAAQESYSGEYDPIARCLTSKGIKMYGSDESSSTLKQKELFGSSFEYIQYTNCGSASGDCDDAGILSYPTWVISGKKYVGRFSVERLAELGGC